MEILVIEAVSLYLARQNLLADYGISKRDACLINEVRRHGYTQFYFALKEINDSLAFPRDKSR